MNTEKGNFVCAVFHMLDSPPVVAGDGISNDAKPSTMNDPMPVTASLIAPSGDDSTEPMPFFNPSKNPPESVVRFVLQAG